MCFIEILIIYTMSARIRSCLDRIAVTAAESPVDDRDCDVIDDNDVGVRAPNDGTATAMHRHHHQTSIATSEWCGHAVVCGRIALLPSEFLQSFRSTNEVVEQERGCPVLSRLPYSAINPFTADPVKALHFAILV